MEAIYTDNGPQLIECNPRVGGGPVAEYSRKLRGVEMAYEIMMTALNIPVVCSSGSFFFFPFSFPFSSTPFLSVIYTSISSQFLHFIYVIVTFPFTFLSSLSLSHLHSIILSQSLSINSTALY